MPKRRDHQLSLDLPTPEAQPVVGCAAQGIEPEPGSPSPAPVYSLNERRMAKSAAETSKHIDAILDLVRHIK